MAFETPLQHHGMLRDHVRVMAYRAAIFAAARDRVVLDLGCGTGIMSVFAAQAGARRVFAVEKGKVAGLASLMFKANDCLDRVTLIRGNSREVELPERAQLIIHEILGADPFDEDLLPTIADARQRLLAPGGVLLPAAVEVCCVGLELAEVPGPTERIIREAQQFGRQYGVNFDPYLLALEAYRDAIAVNTGRPAEPDVANRVLTDSCLLRRVDFQSDTPVDERPGQLMPSMDGMLDALLIFFHAHLDDHIQLSNSPFAPRTSWGWAIRDLPRRRLIRAGEPVGLRSRIEVIDGRQRILVELD